MNNTTKPDETGTHSRTTRRRTLVLLGGSMAALGGCSDSLNGASGDSGADDDGSPEADKDSEVLVDQTLTESNGNPETIRFEAEPGSTLTVTLDTNETAIFNLVDEETGQPIATLGEGVAYNEKNTLRSIAYGLTETCLLAL